jgi:hypothetical protein
LRLGKKYPKNIIMLRYEDLCLDPYGTMDRLVKILNNQPDPGLIEQYIRSHTGKSRSGEHIHIDEAIHDNPRSNVKNSALKAFEWGTKISVPFAANSLKKIAKNL